MAKLAIIGYGKMGKMLEQLIRENPQHQLTWIGNNTPDITNLKEADAAIEFSVPEAAEKIFYAVLKPVSRWQVALPAGQTDFLP